jgi:hypothetical protein
MLHHPFVDPDELKVVEAPDLTVRSFTRIHLISTIILSILGPKTMILMWRRGVIWKGTEKEAHLDGNVDN